MALGQGLLYSQGSDVIPRDMISFMKSYVRSLWRGLEPTSADHAGQGLLYSQGSDVIPRDMISFMKSYVRSLWRGLEPTSADHAPQL
ncbi:hypothetical protein J6590_045120 [Homalodisca vitripennis]|nr:hypothetical protein J6590_045120 [Homalodisca vitripennis]